MHASLLFATEISEPITHVFDWTNKTKEHYSPVLGFRSGALDLFTFLGVPAVSILLRNLVGNLHHNDIPKNKFKRIKCEYDAPRHTSTA